MERLVCFEDEEGFALTGRDLIAVVSRVLENACENNAMVSVEDSSLPKCFFGTKRQKFSLEVYVTRLYEFLDCSDSAFIVALIYLERMAIADPTQCITHLTVHRLYATALLLSIKIQDDEHFGNSYYADVFGMRGLDEVNNLEAKMLSLLDFRLSVSEKEYCYSKSHLLQERLIMANANALDMGSANFIVSAA